MTYETENPDIQALRPRLQAPDAGMRRIALIDLADLEDPDGLVWLVDSLRHDPATDNQCPNISTGTFFHELLYQEVYTFYIKCLHHGFSGFRRFGQHHSISMRSPCNFYNQRGATCQLYDIFKTR